MSIIEGHDCVSFLVTFLVRAESSSESVFPEANQVFISLRRLSAECPGKLQVEPSIRCCQADLRQVPGWLDMLSRLANDPLLICCPCTCTMTRLWGGLGLWVTRNHTNGYCSVHSQPGEGPSSDAVWRMSKEQV